MSTRRHRQSVVACSILAVQLFGFAKMSVSAGDDVTSFTSNLPLVTLETHGQSITQWQRFPITVTIRGTTNGRSSKVSSPLPSCSITWSLPMP